MRSPRLGCVKYLNARPLIHGWPGEFVLDHPAALCAQLARGELDVALVSCFEFLRNPIYRIVDGVSISSRGPVYSVVLAHVGEIYEVQRIGVDPASQTSGNLLRCLLAERGLYPDVAARPTIDVSTRTALLLIGDQAIRYRREHAEFRYWDLGEEWNRIVDLPFVFALWLIRPEVGDAGRIADRLRALCDHNLAHLDDVIASEKEFDPGFCRRYFREHLRFNFGQKEKAGLLEFYRRCIELRLLDRKFERGGLDLELSRRCS